MKKRNRRKAVAFACRDAVQLPWSIESLEPRQLLSVSLLSDINKAPLSASSLGQPVDVNGTLFFADSDGAHGTELWKSDGTSAGTVLVKDINPGRANSAPANLTSVNGVLYFSANDGLHGDDELWRSDGTASGTYMIADLVPNRTSLIAAPNGFSAFGNQLLFFFSDPQNGTALWMFDGTTLQMLKSFGAVVGTGFQVPTYPVVMGSSLYFIIDGGSAPGLWKSSGTTESTVQVSTALPRFGSQNQFMVSTGSTLFFQRNSYELWASDGTGAGTRKVGAINGSSSNSSDFISNLTAVGNNVFFTAADSSTGRELWASDGATVWQVKDIVGGTGGSNPSSLAAMGGRLYFAATESTHGNELWSSDGTAGGTNILSDIRAGSGSSNPVNMTAIGSTLYFAANSTSGAGLWKSTGFGGVTSFVKTLNRESTNPPHAFVLSAGGKVFFVGTESVAGTELWRTDGSAAGTSLVKDVDVTTAAANPRIIGTYNGRLYFFADDGVNGIQPWSTDGTSAGTSLLKVILTGSSTVSNVPVQARVAGGFLFFATQDVALTGYQLWRTNGTSAGTILLKSLTALPNSWGVIGSNVYFTLSGAQGLWTSDGSAAGTAQLTTTGLQSISTSMNGILYGVGTDAANGSQVWRSDGTAAGTQRLTSIIVGTPSGLTAINGTLYFFDNSSVAGDGLWRTDGTAGAEAFLGFVDFQPTNDSVAAVGSKLFFTDLTRMYVSDGTPAGTFAIPGVAAGGCLTNFNGVLLYAGSVNGVGELMRSDGTAAGTYPLAALTLHGPPLPQPSNWVVIGTVCYFETDGSVQGVWRTDGTAAGTYMVDNIHPDAFGLSSKPVEMAAVGGNPIFTADDSISGAEWWKYVPDNTPMSVQSAVFSQSTAVAGQAFSITFQFDRQLSDTAINAGLVLVNLTTGVTVPTANMYRTDSGNDVTFTFTGYSGGILPDGNYIATLPAGGACDTANNPQATDSVLTFFNVLGDLNADRYVDDADQSIVSANQGQTGKAYIEGDVNGDGVVDGADLAALTNDWHDYIPPQGTSVIPSSSGDDQYYLREKAFSPWTEIYSGNSATGDPVYRVPPSFVTSWSSGDGNDQLVLDFTNGSLFASTLSTFPIDGGAGTNSVMIVTAAGFRTLALSPATIQAGSLTIALNNVSQQQVEPVGGNVSLAITDVAVGFPPFASPPIQWVLTSLTFAGAGKLDLTNNDLVVPTAVATVQSYLKSGQVFTSSAGGTVGYRDLGGQTELRFTLSGDSDLNQKVNVADLANLAGNFGKTAGQFWLNGDFDYNGNVNVADLADLAGNFGKSLAGGTAAVAAAPAAVPEGSAVTAPIEPPSTVPSSIVAAPFSDSTTDSLYRQLEAIWATI